MALIDDGKIQAWADRLAEIINKLERADVDWGALPMLRALHREIEREASWRSRASSNR
jgi:hypothetical protein